MRANCLLSIMYDLVMYDLSGENELDLEALRAINTR
jgi:hypothetical protein